MRTRLRSLLWPALTILSIVFVATAWAMDSPVGAGPDEPTHIIHAYGVATGQTLPANEILKVDANGVVLTEIRVPAALQEYQDLKCYLSKPASTPSCGFVEAQPAQAKQVTLPSYMTRYPPLYYAAAGVVIRVALAAGASGHEALVATRIASGAACLAMVLLGAALLRRRFSGPGPALMVLAALTPVSLSLFSTVNPNGVEIAAAVLTSAFVCVLREDYRHSSHAHPWLLAGFVVSLTILTWTRPLSLVWAGLLLGALLLPGGMLPALRRRRPELIAFGVAVLCLAAAAGWLIYSTATRTLGAHDDNAQWSKFPLPVKIVMVFLKFGDLLKQMMGLMGSDTTLPLMLELTWSILTVVVLCLFAYGARRATTSLSNATAFALSSVFVVGTYSVLTAFGWQGRYWLPAVAAALILCVPSLQGRHLDARSSKRLAVGAATLFALMQVSGFLWHLWRYVYGVSSSYPRFEPIPLPRPIAGWLPPIGQPLTFALLLIGTASLTLLLLRDSWRTPRRAETAAPAHADASHEGSSARPARDLG
ncbi:MAG: DUF2142 domain-containing protein [Dermatophilaceae bacterium]